LFRKVVAVWDAAADDRISGEGGPKAVGPRAPEEIWTGDVGGALKTLRSRLATFGTSVEDLAALVLLLGFVAFAIDWFLRIF
jgi:hypothetical protein